MMDLVSHFDQSEQAIIDSTAFATKVEQRAAAPGTQVDARAVRVLQTGTDFLVFSPISATSRITPGERTGAADSGYELASNYANELENSDEFEDDSFANLSPHALQVAIANSNRARLFEMQSHAETTARENEERIKILTHRLRLLDPAVKESEIKFIENLTSEVEEIDRDAKALLQKYL